MAPSNPALLRCSGDTTAGGKLEIENFFDSARPSGDILNSASGLPGETMLSVFGMADGGDDKEEGEEEEEEEDDVEDDDVEDEEEEDDKGEEEEEVAKAAAPPSPPSLPSSQTTATANEGDRLTGDERPLPSNPPPPPPPPMALALPPRGGVTGREGRWPIRRRCELLGGRRGRSGTIGSPAASPAALREARKDAFFIRVLASPVSIVCRMLARPPAVSSGEPGGTCGDNAGDDPSCDRLRRDSRFAIEGDRPPATATRAAATTLSALRSKPVEVRSMASELRRRTRAARRVAALVVGFSECRRPRPLRPLGGVGGRVARMGSTREAPRGAEDDAEAEDAACEVEVAAETEIEVAAEAEAEAEVAAEVAAEAAKALRSLAEIPTPPPAVSAAAPRIVAAGRAAAGR